MPTIQDIADKMGISKGTVSKALNDAPDISETLQKQILETAVEMGYTRIRRQRNNRKQICVLAAYQNIEYAEPHHFAYDIVLGFRQMAEPAGYDVTIVPVDFDLQRSISYDAFMLQHQYEGSFLIGFALSDPWMEELKTSQIPAVLYDNCIMGNPATSYVSVDNDEGMYLAVSHLARLGHDRIGYLGTAPGSHIMNLRQKAFFQAMEQNGLEAGPESAGSAEYISECIKKHLPRLLKSGVSAVICSHDQLAQSVLYHCQELGLRVPEDVSVIGYDDIPVCAYTNPPLTTVRQDRVQLGKSGYYALASLMDGVSIGSIMLHASLVVRKSTGKHSST